ncbi:MAG: hypothetical protein ACRDKS_05615 [Actinomycetota bacterium]
MARRKSIIAMGVVAALAAGVIAALAARGDDKQAAGGQQTPPPPPATVTFDDGEWTIVTPAGWTKENVTKTTDAEKAVRYNGPDGEYFIVAIDPLGSDYTFDGLWTYAVKNGHFKVVAKQDCTGGADQGCSTDDNRYSGYVMWKTGTQPKKVGGHVFYFMFGNATKTTVDASMIEGILESITVNA